MKMIWKGAVALSIAIASLGAAVVPAQAQNYGSHRENWRGDDRGRDWRDARRNDRRWDDRRRDDRRNWRDDRRDNRWSGGRQYCQNEWVRSPYSGKRVRVRVCR